MATEESSSPGNKSMKTVDMPDDEYDSDREMTEEEYLAYLDEIDNSDGFDISGNIYMGGGLCGGIIPMDVRQQRDKSSDYDRYSRVAVDEYNRRLKGELEFVEVLKVMSAASKVTKFYITFEAKDFADGANIKIYQAKILLNLACEISVSSFRLKPPEDDQGSRNHSRGWFWDNNRR